MPAEYQGVILRSAGDPILDLRPPAGMTPAMQRRVLDTLGDYNREHLAARHDNSELAARIGSYEMAFNMQQHAPEAVDLSRESEDTRELYGMNDKRTEEFGRRCLLARRMVERGVRFVQLYAGGAHNDDNWDAHGDLLKNHNYHAGRTDKPIAGLLKDLKRRGLLDETLVVWGGEFGRTVYCQGHLTKEEYGRDHHPRCFTIWLAGAGIRPGMTYGATDEFGYNITENPVHVHDLQATILQQLGIDHEKLTYKHQGRYYRLTDVHGKVVQAVLQS
jgi:hypothetical protein